MRTSFAQLETVLLDSAGWCLANPSLAKLALAPAERPSLEPPADRPSFQLLVRDILVLGQAQGKIRADEDPNFMALVLLGIYGQAMLSALAGVSGETSMQFSRIASMGNSSRGSCFMISR